MYPGLDYQASDFLQTTAFGIVNSFYLSLCQNIPVSNCRDLVINVLVQKMWGEGSETSGRVSRAGCVYSFILPHLLLVNHSLTLSYPVSGCHPLCLRVEVKRIIGMMSLHEYRINAVQVPTAYIYSLPSFLMSRQISILLGLLEVVPIVMSLILLPTAIAPEE